MGFLGLNWFRSQQEKELESLKVEEQKIKNELLKEKVQNNNKVKLYRTLKLVNNNLTVVLNDGTLLSKSKSSEEDFNRVRLAKTEDEILEIFSSKEIVDKKNEVKKTIEAIDLLKNAEDFVVKDGSVYLKAKGVIINRSLPALLINKFTKVLDKPEEYEALKKFWLKCCSNPNARSAEDLYEFLEKHQFKIDKHGNFYAYRRVKSTNDENKDLIEFISNTYTKVKAIWKKRPSDFFVYKIENGYKLAKSIDEANSVEELGDLETLYLNLPNMQKKHYTSSHTGLEDYRVGEVISMPRNEGDDNNTVSCSRGYHQASKEYDYSGFGDTPILTIVNPVDVLAVPQNEVGKLRVCRWFFAAVLGEDEQHILDNEDFDVENLGDIFEEKCLENMGEYIQNSFAEEVKRHTFDLSKVSSNEIDVIVKSLEEMKEIINNRVKQI